MKTHHLLLILLMAGLVSSCNRKAAITKSKVKTPVTEKKVKIEKAIDGALHGAVLLSLERMPCRGTCPWDKVTYYEDGIAFYTGNKYVDKIGNYKAQYDQESLQKLIRQAQKIGFSKMADDYPTDPAQKIADVPITKMSIQNKTITLQNDFPPALGQLVKDVVTTTQNQKFHKLDAVDQTVKAPKKDHGTLTLTIKRSPCYGSCPWYEARFYDDGTILYDGKKHVEHIGKFTLHTSPKTIRSLANKAQKIGFFKMGKAYPANPEHKIPDLPTTLLMVRNGRSEKTISLQNEIPPVLIEYIEEIESTLARLNYPEKE